MGNKLLNCGSSSIGWHRHGTMLTCPQKYAFAHVMEISGLAKSKDLSLGTAIHQGLAHHYLKMGDPAQFEKLNLAEPAAAVQLSIGAKHESAAHAKYLFDAYLKFYPVAAEQALWEVLMVEEELFHDIDGKPYCQRADLVARRRSDGKVFVWDHKTMGGFGQEYGAQQYGMSGQILGLQWLGQKIWLKEFGGVLINAIRKQPFGAPEKRFFREEPPPAPDAVERLPDAVVQARRLISEYSKRDPRDYPRVLDPSVCYAYRGCGFLHLCRFGS